MSESSVNCTSKSMIYKMMIQCLVMGQCKLAGRPNHEVVDRVREAIFDNSMEENSEARHK